MIQKCDNRKVVIFLRRSSFGGMSVASLLFQYKPGRVQHVKR
ncbi:hypothetical protein E6C60_1647 [Paenibacillus algicola]|uniref:Uncharacterized protein n=1 Tax=Paenibacillus algicola TaxID=2565926 RepID=A0A4P8XID9_9BACL|nr:hypothetical protein E6C60_1647 [Paenibacillus algicola]